MAHLTTSFEYGMHSLLWLAKSGGVLSSRALVNLQGISPSYLAKIFPKLEKAGIVKASEGVTGGYRLARPPEDISFLDVMTAIDGGKPLSDCQNVRENCAVFVGSAPHWATTGVCAIHAAMLQAEKAMRRQLAQHSIAEIVEHLSQEASEEFFDTAWAGTNARLNKRARAGPERRAPS